MSDHPTEPPAVAEPPADGDQRPSDAFILNAIQPQNLGVLPQPDGIGAPVGSCGDSLEIGLQVRDNVITRIAFMPHGCAATVAVGSAVTRLALGRTVTEAGAITARDVTDFLEGLPPGHGHCAKLGVATLRAALRDFYRHGRQSWKRMYDTRRQP
ncbi:MAG: iron-sulfur cluster assembly scaffold protein, partial [Proteobacteria bacterium]|nr:iron-sulfur cluster assembly scaffold protein [Pseudomonadota bacterium]